MTLPFFDDMVDIEVADGERRVAWEQFHCVAHFQWTGIVGVEDPVFLIVARNLVVVILDYGLGCANRLRAHICHDVVGPATENRRKYGGGLFEPLAPGQRGIRPWLRMSRVEFP